jgi:hypothetical protein
MPRILSPWGDTICHAIRAPRSHRHRLVEQRVHGLRAEQLVDPPRRSAVGSVSAAWSSALVRRNSTTTAERATSELTAMACRMPCAPAGNGFYAESSQPLAATHRSRAAGPPRRSIAEL